MRVRIMYLCVFKTTTIPRLYLVWFRDIIKGLILSLRPANRRCRYKVTPSLIGWAQTLNQLCNYTVVRKMNSGWHSWGVDFTPHIFETHISAMSKAQPKSNFSVLEPLQYNVLFSYAAMTVVITGIVYMVENHKWSHYSLLQLCAMPPFVCYVDDISHHVKAMYLVFSRTCEYCCIMLQIHTGLLLYFNVAFLFSPYPVY